MVQPVRAMYGVSLQVPGLCPLHSCPQSLVLTSPGEHPKRCFNVPACPDNFPVVMVTQQEQLEPVASL